MSLRSAPRLPPPPPPPWCQGRQWRDHAPASQEAGAPHLGYQQELVGEPKVLPPLSSDKVRFLRSESSGRAGFRRMSERKAPEMP